MSWSIWDLWNIINQALSLIQSFFQSLWSTISSIQNTGQGVFAGLSALGSAIWDALIKITQNIASAITSAFTTFAEGLKNLADILGGWLSTMGQWLSAGLQWVANAVWSFGSWIYCALTFVWDFVVNVVSGVWSAITSFFSGFQSAIGQWWASVSSSVNAWFTNFVLGIRRKLIQTIMTDISIYFGWKSIERMVKAKDFKTMGLSTIGLLASPLVGYLFGSMVNGLVPTPSTEPIELIPSIPMFEYSPPALTITRPSERVPIEAVPPSYPTPPVVGYTPTTSKTITLMSPTYTTTTQMGASASQTLTEPSLTLNVQIL